MIGGRKKQSQERAFPFDKVQNKLRLKQLEKGIRQADPTKRNMKLTRRPEVQ